MKFVIIFETLPLLLSLVAAAADHEDTHHQHLRHASTSSWLPRSYLTFDELSRSENEFGFEVAGSRSSEETLDHYDRDLKTAEAQELFLPRRDLQEGCPTRFPACRASFLGYYTFCSPVILTDPSPGVFGGTCSDNCETICESLPVRFCRRSGTVPVCQINRANRSRSRTRCIPEEEVAEHLSHGDFEGNCNEDCEKVCQDWEENISCVRVEMCRIPSWNPTNFRTSCVSEWDGSAVENRLDRGWLEGNCNDHCETLCSDIDECTTVDDCEQNGCPSTGNRRLQDCDDGNPCTQDSCDPEVGCVNTPMSDGTPCDDGNLCTTGDVCSSGTCGGTAVDCPDDDPCNDYSCDTATGGCVASPVDDGEPCDDGDECTVGDSCISGTCVAGDPRICDDNAGDPCLEDVCDPEMGCVSNPWNNGFPCDDGNNCTTDDVCMSGTCVGGPPLVCNDNAGNLCRRDGCDPGSGCVSFPQNEGSPCEDGNKCTVDGLCVEGTCVGSPRVCNNNADNLCRVDSCDPDMGCVSTPQNEGLSCDDGDMCTLEDKCVEGTCVGSRRDCRDANPCTIDSCDSGSGCVHEQVTDGTPCDDLNACTEGDNCTSGVCVGSVINCDDGNSCTVDSCESGSGCVNAMVADGTACDDLDACTEGDNCTSGVCVGSLINCDDGNPCTVDSCDSDSGCVSAPVADGTGCDDLDACTQEASCASGMCVGSDPVDCDDDNPCTTDSCDSSLGCVNAPVQDGTSCDDGDACTLSTCEDGLCEGSGGDDIVCNDNNPCTYDTCDSSLGCVYTPNTGAPCNDDDPCTRDDMCTGDTCGGTAVVCPNDDPCSDNSCNPATGECVATPLTGPECDDGDPCTTQDVCNGGTCGGIAVVCDTGEVCADGTCVATFDCFDTREELDDAIDSYYPSLIDEQHGPIENWCFNGPFDFSELFYRIDVSWSNFNPDLSDWDTSGVFTMRSMFSGATHFDQDISSWNTSSVTDMAWMFGRSSGTAENVMFNQPIGIWDTSQVLSMAGMFRGAGHFNQRLDDWDTSKVVDMQFMFRSALRFNGEIGSWDVSSVTNMESMISNAQRFNQNISAWDVSRVMRFQNFAKNEMDFNQNLCPWGPRIGANTVDTPDVAGMFGSQTQCPHPGAPNLNANPVSPLCHTCLPD